MIYNVIRLIINKKFRKGIKMVNIPLHFDREENTKKVQEAM